MILETDSGSHAKIVEQFTQVVSLNFEVIFDYTDFIDFYTQIISILYHVFERQDKFVVNSTISFFCVFRQYILENGGRNINEQVALAFFENALFRMKILIDKKKEPIYLYRCNLEIQRFCEYYDFNVVYVQDEKEFESLLRARANRKNIF